MITDSEVKEFFEKLNPQGIANELSPDEFAVLFLSYWKEEHSLTAEELAEWLFLLMFKFIDLIPFGPTPNFDETKDVNLVVKRMMNKTDEEILSSSLKSVNENEEKVFEKQMNFMNSKYPDTAGEQTASTFLKLKKAGLINFHFQIQTGQFEFQASQLSCKIIKILKIFMI